MRSSLPVVVLSLLASMLGSACQAAIIRAPGVPEEEEPPPIEDPAAYFDDNVYPILQAQCATCHTDSGTSAGTVFLDPAGDYYASIWAYDDGGLFIPGDGAGSLLVRKVTVEAHRGGTVSDNDAATFRAWIDAEGEAMMPPPPPPPPLPIMTGFYAVNDGENRIPLAEVGLPGCELIFQATRINDGANLLMTDVEFAAGAGGLSVAHPRFLIRDDVTEATTEDRDIFSTVTLRVNEGMRGSLTGTHVIAAFPMAGSLAVQFESASTN